METGQRRRWRIFHGKPRRKRLPSSGGNCSNQTKSYMRTMTTASEIRRPTPENSAIETNSAASESSAGVEEMPVVLGTAAFTGFMVV